MVERLILSCSRRLSMTSRQLQQDPDHDSNTHPQQFHVIPMRTFRSSGVQQFVRGAETGTADNFQQVYLNRNSLSGPEVVGIKCHLLVG